MRSTVLAGLAALLFGASAKAQICMAPPLSLNTDQGSSAVRALRRRLRPTRAPTGMPAGAWIYAEASSRSTLYVMAPSSSRRVEARLFFRGDDKAPFGRTATVLDFCP